VIVFLWLLIVAWNHAVNLPAFMVVTLLLIVVGISTIVHARRTKTRCILGRSDEITVYFIRQVGHTWSAGRFASLPIADLEQ